MASKKPRESQPQSGESSISEHASDWIRQFVKHLELNFLDISRTLAPKARLADYQNATVRAALRTLLDSGMDAEPIVETIGQALIEQRPGFIGWNSTLNQRRFELIDKEIQETLTAEERIELAGLTRIMREQVETETHLPLEGGKALHRKLLELNLPDKPR